MITKDKKNIDFRWLGIPIITLLAACGSESDNKPDENTSLTDSYKIEYLPGMHGSVSGKTEFTLKVSDRSDVALTGLDVSIKPKMMMDSGNIHGTAYEEICNESVTSGEYDCTVYYLMPSTMMNGTSMGTWELKVMIGGDDGEYTFFNPAVTMAMGDTAQVRLKGQDDKISSSISETEARTYYLFKKALTGMTDNHDFEIFIAAKENMMDYPAIYAGATLSNGDMNHELSIVTMSVEVSTDAVNWTDAMDHGANGHHHGKWVASGISGLTEAEEATIYVKLTVEGEQKTTDGEFPNTLPATDDSNNNYAKFIVTPSNSGM